MEIEPILRALFGPSNNRHAEAREALRRAFQAARSDKYAATVVRVTPDPAGARWVAKGNQLTIDRKVRPADLDAAMDPLRQQLQTAIHSMASELVESVGRLSNFLTWRSLPATAAAFRDVVDGDSLRMPERLGEAYRDSG